jgi:hypothetical protein
MSNNEIKEKYGIEPIMKEMWVWDSDKERALLSFVVLKRQENLYLTFNSNGIYNHYYNVSETNPNDKEPKVGDKGYFYENEGFYLFGELFKIQDGFYVPKEVMLSAFKNFSHEKQPWMK